MRWILLVLLLCSEGWAGDNFSKLQVFQVYYSGEEEKTFSNDNPGTGFELGVTTENDRWNWVAKGRLTTISGSQDFNDGGTSRESDFQFYQSAFEGGFVWYPLERKKRGLNIYIGVNALVSFNYLSLDSDSLTELDPSYQGTSFGYTGNIGVDWYLFKSDRWCFTFEFSQRYETVNLVKESSFSLGGFSLGAGFSW